ncbi:MAG: hypothetical protein Q6370_025430 [Candidatus Sigynarchaeota archaeon]
MARLTKAESEKRKAAIAALLAKNVPWAEIVKQLGCSFQTIAAVSNGSGNRSGTQARAPAPDAQDPRILASLKFYMGLFDRFSETIVSHPEIMEYVIENQDKIKEAEFLCQHS